MPHALQAHMCPGMHPSVSSCTRVQLRHCSARQPGARGGIGGPTRNTCQTPHCARAATAGHGDRPAQRERAAGGGDGRPPGARARGQPRRVRAGFPVLPRPVGGHPGPLRAGGRRRAAGAGAAQDPAATLLQSSLAAATSLERMPLSLGVARGRAAALHGSARAAQAAHASAQWKAVPSASHKPPSTTAHPALHRT